MNYYIKWLQLYSYINCLETEGNMSSATAEDMRKLMDSLKLIVSQADEQEELLKK